MSKEDNNLEMLLVGLLPENKIKVDAVADSKAGACIVVNVDDKTLKFTIPEIDPINKIISPDVDWAMEFNQVIVNEIRNQLNQNGDEKN